MSEEIREQERWAEQELSLVQLMSTIIPNELLFSLFYLLGEWKTKITLVKLCKMLNNTDQKLIRDHLNLLLRNGLLEKSGDQYQISLKAEKCLQLLEDAVGNIPDPTWIVSPSSTDTLSNVIEHSALSHAANAGATVILSGAAPELGSADHKIRSGHETLDEGIRSSSDSTFLGEEAHADAA